MNDKYKKLIILGITAIIVILSYIFLRKVDPFLLTEFGNNLPLPLFTIIIAVVDGFNPCNLFILTMLLSLILTESQSRKRTFAVGYSFIMVVYIFYFLFMAAWLNVFKYVGFITPLRITIALLAIIAGLINVKELFFYRQGITLMVQDKFVGPLKERIQKVAEIIKKGSIPTLIGASVILAIFSSLVELPCTAGFPIIYTGILTGHSITGLGHYLYLALYNLFYVTPLLVIVTVFGLTFKGKQIKKETMALIKFIGGTIMLLLGIVLLFNPGIIGV
ncbi:MAG: hypothetical protein ABIB43_04705 [archaeon]